MFETIDLLDVNQVHKEVTPFVKGSTDARSLTMWRAGFILKDNNNWRFNVQ